MGLKIRLRNGDGTFKADESDLSHIDTDFISGGGVTDLSIDCIVTQDTGSNRNVAITKGNAYIRNNAYSKSQKITRFYSSEMGDASTLVAISPNTTLATRVDYVCIKIDTAVTPDATGSNLVASYVSVTGVSNGVAPAIPANYQVLARLDLPLNFTAITNAIITDMRVQVSLDSGDWKLIDKSEDPLAVTGALSIVQYVSVSSFKIFGDWTGKIGKGTKIKFTQNGTIKYFYTISSGAVSAGYTTFTTPITTDFALTNAVITRFYYSNANPLDFPPRFNWNLTLSVPTGTYTSQTVISAKFWITARIVNCQFAFLGTLGGTIPNVIFYSLPVSGVATNDPQNLSGIANDSEILLCDVSNIDVSKGRLVRTGGFPNFTANVWGARYGGFLTYDF